MIKTYVPIHESSSSIRQMNISPTRSCRIAIPIAQFAINDAYRPISCGRRCQPKLCSVKLVSPGWGAHCSNPNNRMSQLGRCRLTTSKMNKGMTLPHSLSSMPSGSRVKSCQNMAVKKTGRHAFYPTRSCKNVTYAKGFQPTSGVLRPAYHGIGRKSGPAVPRPPHDLSLSG